MGYYQFTGRRLSRVLALEALYRFDLLDEPLSEAIKDIYNRENPPEDVRKFTNKILESVESNLEEIDRLIDQTTLNWPLERITTVDRSILRIAVGEMLGIDEVPFKVSISEAIEIAKLFSTEESGRFVNGVLDNIAIKLGFKQEEKS